MNTLIRWNPFGEMEELNRRLSSAFGLTPARITNGHEEQPAAAEWLPLVDITEDEREYLIKAELPEVRKEDVKVTVEDGTLTIAGQRKFAKEEAGRRYHRIERAYGSFARNFALPDNVEPDKVNAEFKDGLLTVRLAKVENARPKTIEVKVA